MRKFSFLFISLLISELIQRRFF